MSSTAARDPRVERTRSHVLTQARQLLGQGGPDAVTYAALAARARVTRQTLYRHWPTREALFVELALEGAEHDLPSGAGPPDAIIRGFLRSLSAAMIEASHASPLTALVARADHDETSRRALETIVEQQRGALNALLAGSGVVLDEEHYARLCGPVLFQRFFARRPVTGELIDQLVDQQVDDRSD